MTWPEQDPYSSPPYSSAPYQANPQSAPPAAQYPPQDPYAAQQAQYGQQAPYQQQAQYGQQPPYQQQAQPAQYGQPQYPPYGYQQPSGTNTMAILSLVLAFAFWPAAIVCGHIAKKQLRQSGEQGDGLATAGLVLGYIFGGLSLVFCGIYIIAIITAVSEGTSV